MSSSRLSSATPSATAALSSSKYPTIAAGKKKTSLRLGTSPTLKPWRIPAGGEKKETAGQGVARAPPENKDSPPRAENTPAAAWGVWSGGPQPGGAPAS